MNPKIGLIDSDQRFTDLIERRFAGASDMRFR